jgi:hypothetical protein
MLDELENVRWDLESQPTSNAKVKSRSVCKADAE